MHRSMRGILVVLATLRAAAAPALSQCLPEWLPGASGQFASYGANSSVHGGTIWFAPGSGAPRLVIAGQFTGLAGGGPFNRIAAWDGTRWTGFGAGLTIIGQPNLGQVSSVIDFNGDLVVTGGFTTAGTVTALNIARWNGSAWQPMGNINNTGQVLEVFNGQLYLGGGTFTQVTPRTGLLRWNGAEWETFGGGIDGPVLALEVFNNELVAGGLFAQAGAIAATNIVRWNGSAWSALGTGANNRVLALRHRPADNSLYVGGIFTGAGGLNTGGFARWDGAAWHPNGGHFAGEVRTLEHYGDKIVIGGVFPGLPGNPSIAQYDGANYTNLGSGGAAGPVNTLTVFNDSLIVGGAFAAIGGQTVDNLAQWSGAPVGGWSQLRPGPNAPVRALLSAGPSFYAAGDFDFTINGATTAHRIVTTDGTNLGVLAPLPTAVNGTNGLIRGMAFFATSPLQPSRLIVGGSFTQAGGLNAANIAQFEIGGWSAMGTGTNGQVNAVIQFGSQLNARVIATGEFTTAGGMPCNRIAQWSGTWNPLGSGLAGGSGNALAIFSGALHVAGQFTSAGGVPASDIARWNGTAWSALDGTQFVGAMNALTVFSGQLIAAGDFQSISGPTVRSAAAWTGSAWVPMHAGLPLPGEGFFPMALAVHNGELYLGGQYSTTDGGDGIFHSTVYRWNGASWVAAAGPLSGGVLALTSAVGSLWAGGSFTVGSGHATPYLARLACPCYANCDRSAGVSVLNVNDFVCFQNSFAAQDPYANCDGSTAPPVLNVNDFICFQSRFAAGCP